MTNNFHSSCKQMHLSFKSIFNKEHKRAIFNMTSSSNSSHEWHFCFLHKQMRKQSVIATCGGKRG